MRCQFQKVRPSDGPPTSSQLGASVRVVSKELTGEIAPLLQRLPANPITFLRHGEGIVGLGEHAHLTATGASRFAELSAAWLALVAEAEVTDEVNLPGSGLLERLDTVLPGVLLKT